MISGLSGLSGVSGVFGGSFSPLSLSPALWLDATVASSLFQDSALTTPATADADPVGGWKDLSGNGNHVAQATTTKRPALKLAIQNGLPVIQFDGVDDFLSMPAAASLGTSYTAHVVYRPTGAIGTSCLVGQDVQYALAVDNTLIYLNDGVNVVSVAHGGLSSGVAHVLTARRAGTTVSFFKDGTQLGVNQTLATNNSRSVQSVGARADGALPAIGGIGEVVVSTGDSVSAALSAYFRSKWATP